MSSIGGLVDRLSIVNIKLFHVQDQMHQYAAMSSADFAETDSDAVHEAIQNVVKLNLERNRLMTEADTCLNDAVSTGRTEVDARVKLV